MTSVAEIKLWGTTIGAVSLEDDETVATFQYTPEFAASDIEVAPLTMPLRIAPYRFAALPLESFHGLPGLLADSLPDRFGQSLIAAWLGSQGRSTTDLNAVERLCYTGRRGMGALEYAPILGPRARKSQKLQVDKLVALAARILARRTSLAVRLSEEQQVFDQILRVGTSAGGARAKAVIAYNQQTEEVRSGQVEAPPGFSHWILKFDGVSGNKDKELEDPKGYCAIEYAYSLMARDCGIEMTECHLFEENDRRHFLTKRFDRSDSGDKIHMLSLAGMAHYDFNDPASNSYEDAFQVMRRLGLPKEQHEQQFIRMAFNILARNQDDHVKNIAFLMDKRGRWRLSPAYDLTYSYNPDGLWTARHQMSMNGRRENFCLADFVACGKFISLKRGRALELVERVAASVSNWPAFAESAKIPERVMARIGKSHRNLESIS